jgi:hypothetical protein
MLKYFWLGLILKIPAAAKKLLTKFLCESITPLELPVVPDVYINVAKSLGFIHPKTNEYMFFDSELPEDMKTVVEKWRNYISTR